MKRCKIICLLNLKKLKSNLLSVVKLPTKRSDNMSPTKLQIEKARNSALTKQLERYKQENERIVALLKKTQHTLEKQTQHNLTLERQHSETEKAREKQALASARVQKNEMQHLREELLTAQRDLTKQLSLSKQREEDHHKQVERLKLQCELQNNDKSNDESWKSMERRTNTLEQGQSELLELAKKQIKLIEILKEQRNHARAAALLDITEQTFLKEVAV